MLSLQRSFERASQTAAELPRIPQLEPLYRNQDMHIGPLAEKQPWNMTTTHKGL